MPEAKKGPTVSLCSETERISDKWRDRSILPLSGSASDLLSQVIFTSVGCYVGTEI